MDMVERVYGTEVDREAEIKRLNEALETLSNLKSEQMENLRRENEELLNGQEACDWERNRYRTMQEELEAQHAEAEADREEEYKRKLQEEKDKTQKRIKTSKAEIEAESRERVQELEDQNAELSAMNEQLKQWLSDDKRGVTDTYDPASVMARASSGPKPCILAHRRNSSVASKDSISATSIASSSVISWTIKFRNVDIRPVLIILDAIRTMHYDQPLPFSPIEPVFNRGHRILDFQYLLTGAERSAIQQPVDLDIVTFD
ncbi:MAG: hypothetical protein L6R40_008380 [Gallowayella cf. fulva]|nr:MAG: hypothetical protein L6R40_008380 [Xanthomendoza cf. fulva]